MTKQDFEARIVELEKLREARLADMNALGGAIQDCQFWIARLEAQEAEAPAPPRLVTTTEDQ
jgi:hypothetical protein